MDGQTVEMDDKFRDPRTGELVEHPSDPKGSAAMVINCRCTFVTKPAIVTGKIDKKIIDVSDLLNKFVQDEKDV